MMTIVEVVALIAGAMADSVNEDGEVVFDDAARAAVERLIAREALRARDVGRPLDWRLFYSSLEEFDPYDLIDPEERARFPLLPRAVEQNRVLLEHVVGGNWEAAA